VFKLTASLSVVTGSDGDGAGKDCPQKQRSLWMAAMLRVGPWVEISRREPPGLCNSRCQGPAGMHCSSNVRDKSCNTLDTTLHKSVHSTPASGTPSTNTDQNYGWIDTDRPVRLRRRYVQSTEQCWCLLCTTQNLHFHFLQHHLAAQLAEGSLWLLLYAVRLHSPPPTFMEILR